MSKIFNLKQNQKALLIILTVIFVAALSFVVYKVMISNSTAQNNTSSTEPPDSSQDPSDVEQTFLVLGITLDLPGSLKEQLEYVEASSGGNVTARLSTGDVSSADSNCGLGGTDPSLGTLFRVDGQYPAEPSPMNTPGVLAKQLPDFYIAYRALQQECTSDQELNDLISGYKQQLIESFPTIRELK